MKCTTQDEEISRRIRRVEEEGKGEQLTLRTTAPIPVFGQQ
jgi:hypothetical protein